MTRAGGSEMDGLHGRTGQITGHARTAPRQEDRTVLAAVGHRCGMRESPRRWPVHRRAARSPPISEAHATDRVSHAATPVLEIGRAWLIPRARRASRAA
jgi:hypothetical protein